MAGQMTTLAPAWLSIHEPPRNPVLPALCLTTTANTFATVAGLRAPPTYRTAPPTAPGRLPRHMQHALNVQLVLVHQPEVVRAHPAKRRIPVRMQCACSVGASGLWLGAVAPVRSHHQLHYG